MINTFVGKSKIPPPVKTRACRPAFSFTLENTFGRVSALEKKIIESVAGSFALIVAAAG